MFSITSAPESSNFFSFLSSAYGSGNLGLDLSIVGLASLGVVALVTVMQAVGLGRAASIREAEILADVAELLNEMNIQIHELKGLVQQEFTKASSELGFLRNELKQLDVQEIRAAQVARPPAIDNSNSLVELFQ